MNTVERYYQEPYLKELDAKVLLVKGDAVVLDSTICYPEGGGQPGDTGTIGGCKLLDTTRMEDRTIVHHVENPTFHVGDTVHVVLDWKHRYHYMQTHTAQHMVSGTLFTAFHIATVAVHDGEKIVTIETDHSQISEETCYALEDLVNQRIREGHPVHYLESSHEKAEAMGLRRSIKVKGDVRLVIIDDVDIIACGGLHVASTSEVCLLQYVGQEAIRGHVRLIFRAADQALAEIRQNRRLVKELCALHSATVDDLLSVEKQADEQYKTLKAENSHVKEAMCKKAMASFSGIVTWDISEEPFSLKEVAQSLEDRDLALCVVKKEGERLSWLMAFLGGYRSFDFNAHRTQLLSAINGKGGGRTPLYQGMGSGSAADLFASFRSALA